jgi:uncharacterized protein with FMN-binding domain
MTIGIILAVIFLFEVGNIFLRKLRNSGAGKVTSGAHKVVGMIFIGLTILHMVLVWPLIKQRPITMYILGFIMIGCAVIALFSFVFRKKLKQHWITIHKVAALIIGICLILHIVIGITSLNRYKQLVEEIKIENVDISRVADGSYMGDCDTGYVYAKVEVTVKHGTVTSVDLLENRTERGKPAEVITDKIVQNQNVKVDAITGATNSSKVIMKAVENALEGKKLSK